MKHFLRFQVSGSVFLIWLIVFYYGENTDNIVDLFKNILGGLKKYDFAILVIVALPFGAIIHQISALIKNCIVAKCFKEFNDYPESDIINKLDGNKEAVKYCLKSISNLNSYYYVRFDNGVLSPIFAWIVVSYIMDRNIDLTWVYCAFVIGFIMIIYLPRIYSEIKEYKSIIKKIIKPKDSG